MSPPRTLAETLELLEKQLQCAICLETYRDPKALACLHVYCRECIQQLLLGQQRDQEVECPQCRSVGPVAGNDASSLPTMFFINGLIEVRDIMKQAESNEIPCQNCSDAKATSFCHTCGFICTSCNNAHQKMKVFSGHETLLITKMREKALTQLPTKKNPTSSCHKHDGELLKFFCSNCEQLICRDCGLVDHAGHRLVSVKDVTTAFREEVLTSLVPLRDTHATITTAVTRVEDTRKDITDQGADIATTITRSFDQLKAILEDRKQVLLRQVREVVERKVGALDSQHEDLRLALATLDSLVGFVEKTSENASDEEFISMKQQMTSRVQEVTRKYQHVEFSPKELTDTFVAVPPPASLEELCKKSSVCVAKVDGPGLKSATTKQLAKFTVRTLNTHGQPPPPQQHVSAELKSLVDDSVLQTTVVTQTPSTYELSYTPTTRGRHRLTVRVNNTEIGTFQVFVHHPPTQLGTPVRVIDGMNGPYSIALSDTELFVTEDYRYTVLNMQGQRVLTIGSKGKPPFGDGDPTGIATDGDGSVFITNGNHKLWKFSRRGELVKSIGKMGRNDGEFDWPLGVRYRNHQVYVCDSDNARVQVFDSNLNFLRTFGTRGDGPGQLKEPRDLDFDTQGNIYVVDWGKHQVLVFSEVGQYLRHFGQYGEGKGELNHPRGLCVSGDCVYVVEISNNRLSVFNTSGQFVHSFGKKGAGRGELDCACCIATDNDGFVFVCDYGNNRIQVF